MSVATHEISGRSPERKRVPRIPNREEVNTLVREIMALQNAGEEIPGDLQEKALEKLPEAYNYFTALKSPDMGPKELKAMRELIDDMQAAKKVRESDRAHKLKSMDAKMRQADREKAAGIHRNIAAMSSAIDRKGAGIHTLGDMVSEIDGEDGEAMEAISSDDWIADQMNKKKIEEAQPKNTQLNEPKKGFFGRLFGRN